MAAILDIYAADFCPSFGEKIDNSSDSDDFEGFDLGEDGVLDRGHNSSQSSDDFDGFDEAEIGNFDREQGNNFSDISFSSVSSDEESDAVDNNDYDLDDSSGDSDDNVPIAQIAAAARAQVRVQAPRRRQRGQRLIGQTR